MGILFRTFQVFTVKVFGSAWLSDILALGVPDGDCFGSRTCALDLISTFLLHQCTMIHVEMYVVIDVVFNRNIYLKVESRSHYERHLNNTLVVNSCLSLIVKQYLIKVSPSVKE